MRTQDRSPTVSWSCPCRFHSLPLFILLVTTLVTPARSQEPPFALDPPPSTLTLCQAYEFTWTGGAPPYALSIRIPTGQIDAPVALPFTNISASRFTWTPDLIEQGIVARVFDSTGASATSAPFAVQPGSITSCVQGSTLALDQREDSGSSPPPSAARVATPGKRSFTPEAIGAIVVGAVSGALLLSALIICLWSRIRDRRRRGDFERIGQSAVFFQNGPRGAD
ncbi:hypothetical protein C8Q76DRAFT_113487 [Earliella scabrosa]|nr:hypothetical protein C8Q76DRAFT_113487 [Earliella scabrosa]